MNTSAETIAVTERSLIEQVITAVLLSMLIFASVFGNAAVIYIVRVTPSLKTEKYNTFLINLSITDMLSALLVMMTSLIAVSGDLHYVNPIWCNMCCAFNYCLIIVSMLTMTSISVLRYIAIVHPIYYKIKIGMKFIISLIVYSWCQGFAFAFVPVYLEWIEYDYWEAVCAINWQREQQSALSYVIIACILCFFIPGLWILVNYSLVGYHSYKYNVNKKPETRNNAQANRILRSLVVVVLFFFICMTPFCITKLLKVAISTSFVPDPVNLFASFMQYLSSVINPVIYAIFRQDFRKEFAKIFHSILNLFPQRRHSERNQRNTDSKFDSSDFNDSKIRSSYDGNTQTTSCSCRSSNSPEIEIRE